MSAGEGSKRLFGLGKLMLRGKPPVGTTPSDEVFAENKWKLLRYRPRPEGIAHKTPVLLVPSLINRHYVLDLLPDKSVAEWLVGQGFDVYVIDWGTPGPEDRYLTFDDVCDRYLGRAVRMAARTSGVEKAHVLGYCLGGTLTAIYAAVRPEHVQSLTLLAAPVSFANSGMMGEWTRSPTFDVGSIVDAFGNVPWPLMQFAFHMLRPTLPLSKMVHMIDRAWDDEFMDGFLALETWGNDNVSFPGECYRRYIEELYRGDALVKGTFTLSGVPVKLENIHCPVMAVTFEHDTIVPTASASVVLDLVGSKEKKHLHQQGGHVGAVVSRAAKKRLWPELAGFFVASEVKGRGKRVKAVL